MTTSKTRLMYRQQIIFNKKYFVPDVVFVSWRQPRLVNTMELSPVIHAEHSSEELRPGRGNSNVRRWAHATWMEISRSSVPLVDTPDVLGTFLPDTIML